MTLDFVRLAERMDDLVTTIGRESLDREERFHRARRLLAETSIESLRESAERAKNANWLLALPSEPLSTRRPAPGLDGPYAVLATDGSSIDVSRHAPAACYLINIGHAWLEYGASGVDLGNEPELEFETTKLLRGDRSNASKESVMTGNLLDAYRTAREFLRLASLAEKHGGARPLVALLDGQFVLWGLKESELSSDAATAIFDEGVLLALEQLRALSQERRLAIASYISRPAGREVTNVLRIAACPREPFADCNDCPRLPAGPRPCDAVAGGVDADLFAGVLDAGERSAIFQRYSASSDFSHTDTRYTAAGHGLRFFYLHVPGGEIARIEIPEWVADDPASVDLVQAAVLDQCERGAGYPVVLQEAHEQAVIDGADRRSFAALVEREMELRGWWPKTSGKSFSKRRRTI